MNQPHYAENRCREGKDCPPGAAHQDGARKLGEVPFMVPLNNACVRVVRDPRDGREVLYAVFYSHDPQDPPALARIDFERHVYRSYPLPAGRGSWRILQTSDGKLWVGLNGPGQLACFDPSKEQFEPLPEHVFPEPTTHLADLLEGPDGRIYASTGLSHMVLVYNPATGRYRGHRVGDRRDYLNALSWLGDGRLFAASGLRHAVWAVDPETGRTELKTPRRLLDQANAFSHIVRWRDELLLTLTVDERMVEVVRHRAETGDFIGSVRLAVPTSMGRHLFSVDGETLFMGVDGGHILRVDPEHGLAEPAWHIADVPTRVPLYRVLDSNRILVTSNTQYYGVYHIQENRLDLHLAEVESPPTGIFSILPHSSGAVYCTAELGLCLSRFDSKTKQGEMLGITANASGEIYGNAEAADGRIFGISYTHALLTVYDPRRGWAPGAKPLSNPRSLGPLGEEQYRPIIGLLNGPGGKLYTGTWPAYGARGGALTVIDPETETWTVYRDLVPGHSVMGLATDESRVFVGTTVQADGFIEPLDEDAHFLVFDPAAGRVILDLPVEGARSVYAMGCSGGQMYFWAADTAHACTLWRFNIQAGSLELVPNSALILGVSRHPMARTTDGMLWFGHAGGLARLDPDSGEVRKAWTVPGPWGGPFTALGHDLLFAVGRELYLLGAG